MQPPNLGYWLGVAVVAITEPHPGACVALGTNHDFGLGYSGSRPGAARETGTAALLCALQCLARNKDWFVRLVCQESATTFETDAACEVPLRVQRRPPRRALLQH